MIEILNGNEHTVSEKKRSRAGVEITIDVQERIQQTVGDSDLVLSSWEDGLVDLAYDGNEVYMSMTQEQAHLWRQVRRESARRN